MFENIPTNEKEKTREDLLEDLENSFEKYGVEGVEVRLEGDKLVMEQKYGEGIRGLGYDKEKSNLWLCLDQKNSQESINENQRWNANTVLDMEKQFLGVSMKKIEEGKIRIEIDKDNPLFVIASLSGRSENIYLPSEINGWKLEESLEFDEETGKLIGELLWDGDGSIECKVAISGIQSNWDDGEWKDDTNQKMETRLKTE
ncbi:MAG: hypothetical protein KAS01_01240 [Candidatus Pacebacteria bacterium]|nr:hypothetical protein [Candidatus Paceibacterota bacterium]